MPTQMITFFLLLFIPLTSWSVSIEICRTQAEHYGNGQGPSYIDKECVEMAKSRAEEKCKATKLKENILTTVIGYENLIIFSKESKGSKVNPLKIENLTAHFIAGSSTRINQIESLKIDELTNEISVVDAMTGETLIFDFSAAGNVAPKKVVLPVKKP